MLTLSFTGETPDDLAGQVRAYVDALDGIAALNANAPAAPNLSELSKLDEVVARMVGRIGADPARNFLLEVSRATAADQVVPYTGETRTKYGLTDGRAWGGAISPINRAAHIELDIAKDLLVFDNARKGYRVTNRAVAEAVVRLLGSVSSGSDGPK
jgi:hypothetical protein